MDGMLSQEEINALLSNMNSSGSGSGDDEGDFTLNEAEKDAIGEVSNISMGTAATTLFSLLNQRVSITTPTVSYATWEELLKNYERPCVFIQIYYTTGLDGNNILILRERDVKVITDLMMGGDGTNTEGELSELHLSAICEAMNQMMGSAATSLSSMLEKTIDISPPTASLIDLAEVIDTTEIADFLNHKFVKVSFHMVIGDLIDSELMQLYPFDFAKSIYKQFMKYTGLGDLDIESVLAQQEQQEQQQAEAQPAPQPIPQPMPQPMPQPVPQPMPQVPVQPMYPNQQAMPYMMPPVQDVNIAPAQFQPFPQVASPLLQTENIDLLLDVPLEVTAELGRTSKSIKEILDFTPGTVIELNRLAGEQIDVMVNGKYVAKGEVMVIEEAFGIRITEIVK